MLTVPLKGYNVLAKMHKGQAVALTYANREQARIKAVKVGGYVMRFTRAFYVAVPAGAETFFTLD